MLYAEQATFMKLPDQNQLMLYIPIYHIQKLNINISVSGAVHMVD